MNFEKESVNNNNKTMMQYFEWELPPSCGLWNKVANEANYLASIGINYIWLPPAYKGSGGIYDVGYGVYDLYDLGEFDQKGTIPTKYGTKEEYINAIKTLKGNNIQVLADIVFNQKMGADELESVIAYEDNPNNRKKNITTEKVVSVWTKFNFPGRNDKYSSFKWNWTHFHGVDWDEKAKKKGIYRFYGKHWDELVDKEHGNFDYLMGCDVDLNNFDVIEELYTWGKWYIDETNIDGFRIDAIKHIRSTFLKDWILKMREVTSKELPTVGEYWSGDVNALKEYMKQTKNLISLFDVPLHFKFSEISHANGNFDMSTIFDNTLVKEFPNSAITFVDNHDTQLGQSLESWVADWFKPLAYALTLLRSEGIPCVFYGDYYGIPSRNVAPKKDIIEKLLFVRKNFIYGKQVDYLDDPNVIAWVLEGDTDHTDSGAVVIMSDKDGGNKTINVGKKLANTIFYDITGNLSETVYTDQEGNGIFYCNGGSVSVWIKKDNIYERKEN